MKKIIAVLIALLLPAVAVAEEIGCMDVIAHITRRAGGVPEQLNAYVHPIDIMATDGPIQVQMQDALFVDNAAAAAWTIKNTGDEPLYIVSSYGLGGITMNPYSYGLVYGILQPGEKRNCGFSGYLKDRHLADMAENTQPLTVHVLGMQLRGSLIERDEAIDNMVHEFDYRAFNREVSRLFVEEGKLVSGLDGYIELGEEEDSFHFDAESKIPYAAQRYIHSGMLVQDGFVEIEILLNKNVTMRSILPEQSVEVPVSGGLMRLTRADLSPAGLIVEALFTFPDEGTALAFYDNGDHHGRLPIEVIDSNGMASYYGFRSAGFSGSSGYRTFTDGPVLLADGTYAWSYRFEQWYRVSEKDTFYLLLDTSELSDSGVYLGDLSKDSCLIRLEGDVR